MPKKYTLGRRFEKEIRRSVESMERQYRIRDEAEKIGWQTAVCIKPYNPEGVGFKVCLLEIVRFYNNTNINSDLILVRNSRNKTWWFEQRRTSSLYFFKFFKPMK